MNTGIEFAPMLILLALVIGVLLGWFGASLVHRKEEELREYENDCYPKIEPPFKDSEEVRLYRGQLLTRILGDIENHFGGVPSFEERVSEEEPTWQITYDEDQGWRVVKAYGSIDPIAFYAKEDAERFMENYWNRERVVNYYRLG